MKSNHENSRRHLAQSVILHGRKTGLPSPLPTSGDALIFFPMIRRYSDFDRILKNKQNRADRLKQAREKGRHTQNQWESLVCEFGGFCVRCGMNVLRVEEDHIVPIYLGGSDSIENIQPLCARCNACKGSETFNWKEYRREFGFV